MINAVERKEVLWKDVKTWVNELFALNGKELSKGNLGELKTILVSHKQQEYYTFYTNEKREIVITFSLGEVVIRLSNKVLEVTIDESTKRNIYNLRTNYKESVQINAQPRITVEIEEPEEFTTLPTEVPATTPIQSDAFNELAEFSEESFNL